MEDVKNNVAGNIGRSLIFIKNYDTSPRMHRNIRCIRSKRFMLPIVTNCLTIR